jgi:hypothetical protein
VFRRRSQTSDEDATQATSPDQPKSATPRKGRPTPKRKVAEGRRRQPVTAPGNRKEAYKQARLRQNTERARTREGMRRGEERYLPARDKGPVRKFAREWVDSRRVVSQYFLPISLAILLLTWLPFPATVRGLVYAGVITVGWPVMMIGVLATSIWVSWRVKRAALEKFPDESLKGVGFYAAMRSLQIRRLRFPPPTVRPGGRPVLPRK